MIGDTRDVENVCMIATSNSRSVCKTAAKRSRSADLDMNVTENIQMSVNMDDTPDTKTIAATLISPNMHPRLEGSAGRISSLMKNSIG
jgi:hypothetical protein